MCDASVTPTICARTHQHKRVSLKHRPTLVLMQCGLVRAEEQLTETRVQAAVGYPLPSQART